MTHISSKNSLFLPVTLALFLSGCATTLAERTPIDIASNSVRRTDSQSGISEILAPRVKAFSSKQSGVAGSAQLRTAGPFTDTKGIVHRDGAYIDILLNYSTATPNPQEGRLYDNVRWPGGEPALLADFGTSVLDCRQDIRENYIPYNRGYNSGYNGYYYGSGYGYGPYDGYDDDRRWRRDDGYGSGGSGGSSDDDSDTDDTSTTGDDPAPRRPRRRPRRRPQDDGNGPHLDAPGTEPSLPRVTRSAPKPVVSRRRPAPSVSKSKPDARPQRSTSPVRARTSRSVAKRPPARRTNARTKFKRELNYYRNDPYYQGGYTDVTVRYRCLRQETVRVFVPKERLNAANSLGLLLYLRPKNGREAQLMLPPNYIEGFKLAAYSPQGEQLTIQGAPVQFRKSAKRAAATVPPSARAPIVYGQQ